MPLPSADLTARNLQALAERWAANTASERAGFQSWMLEFLEALGAERPLPPTPEHQFELPVRVVDREGRESVNFIDYWKAGHVAVEAKALGGSTDTADDRGLRKAFGQVRNYVAHVPGTLPPYLMVVDVARTAIVWDRWSGAYGWGRPSDSDLVNIASQAPDGHCSAEVGRSLNWPKFNGDILLRRWTLLATDRLRRIFGAEVWRSTFPGCIQVIYG
jgi:hypothetical protein